MINENSRSRIARGSAPTTFTTWLAAIIFLVCGWTPGASAQESEIPGIAFSNGGIIRTGSGYDMFSGMPRRHVVDFEVPNSVGAYPLRCARTLVVSNASGNHYGLVPAKTNWAFEHHYVAFAHQDNIIVRLPSGGNITFRNSQSRSFGSGYRIIRAGSGIEALLLEDGGRVNFQTRRRVADYGSHLDEFDYYVGTEIVDRYGLSITVEPEGLFGPRRVTDASGRWLEYTWSNEGTLTGVESSAGQRVDFAHFQPSYWQWSIISDAYYQDGSSAHYTYSTVTGMRNVPTSLRDTRAVDTNMQEVEYRWALASIHETPQIGWVVVEAEMPFAPPVSVDVTRREILWREVRPDGSDRKFEFDRQLGLLYLETDFRGHEWNYVYDEHGMLSERHDPKGRVTTIDHESVAGKIRWIRYPDNEVERFFYTDADRPYYLDRREDERGYVTHYDRDESNRIWRIRYPDGTDEEWREFDSYNQPGVHKLRDGSFEAFQYDESGRLDVHILPHFSGDPAPQVSYDYYPNGHPWEDRIESVTDPRGHTTRYEYDIAGPANTPIADRGLVTRTVHPDGTDETFRYNAYGDRREYRDEKGFVTEYLYDHYQRRVEERDTLGQRTHYAYRFYDNFTAFTIGVDEYATAFDKPTQVISSDRQCLDAQNALTFSCYDSYLYDADYHLERQVSAVETAQVASNAFEYDQVGNVVRQSDPRGRVTEFVYDARDRVIQKVDPDGHTTEFAYDEAGNVIETLHRDLHATAATYDGMNRKVTSTDERGLVTRYTYDAMGRLKRVRDPQNQYVEQNYDARGNLVTRRRPGPSGQDRSWRTYEYDLADNLIQLDDSRGFEVEYVYDARNRELARTGSQGLNGVDVLTTYDPAGNVQTKTNSEGSITYSYDGLHRVTAEEHRIGNQPARVIHRTYDVVDNPASLTVESFRLEYTYTPRNQLARIQNVTTGEDVVSYSYFPDGQRRTKRVFQKQYEVFDYDGAGRLVSAYAHPVSPPPTPAELRESGVSLFYGYDRRNRRISTLSAVNLTAIEHVYDYRDDGQLETFERRRDDLFDDVDLLRQDFSVDNSGNWLTIGNTVGGEPQFLRFLSPDGFNQYQGASLFLDYDAAGQVTRLKGYDLSYDELGRLNAVVDPTGEVEAIELGYGPEGRLVVIRQGDVARYALYDGLHPIAWFDSNGDVVERNVWGAKRDEVIATFRPAVPGQESDVWHDWIGWQTDIQNNVVSAVDYFGERREVYAYDPFGVMHAFDANSVEQVGESEFNPPYRFTGKLWFETLGIYLFPARAYSPTLGRFLQLDPLGLGAEDANFYRYANNDPINYVDPDGTIVETLWDLANVAWGAKSFAENVTAGNYLEAAADAGGIIMDAAAAATPGAPAGFGASLKAGRAAGAGQRAASSAAKAAKGALDSAAPGISKAADAANAALESAKDALIKKAGGDGGMVGKVPKPRQGSGTVPPSQRDPKRNFSQRDRELKRAEQGNKCPGCDGPIDKNNSNGHHIKRHADGGKTTPENHVEVCIDCHKDLHRK